MNELMDGVFTQTCVICNKVFTEWGNNPYPVKYKGTCCNECNYKEVIPARLKAMEERENNKEEQ